MSDYDDVLGSFYGKTRVWSAPERAAAQALVEHHGWTAARASFIAEWLDASDFWRGKLTSIADVMRNVQAITEQSGAAKQTADRPGWEGYQPYQDPTPPEMADEKEELLATLEQKRAAVRAPWEDLVEEAQALGLKGVQMSRWVFAERERRTGRPSVATKMLDAFVKGAKAGLLDKGRRPQERSDAPRHWTEARE